MCCIELFHAFLLDHFHGNISLAYTVYSEQFFVECHRAGKRWQMIEQRNTHKNTTLKNHAHSSGWYSLAPVCCHAGFLWHVEVCLKALQKVSIAPLKALFKGCAKCVLVWRWDPSGIDTCGDREQRGTYCTCCFVTTAMILCRDQPR